MAKVKQLTEEARKARNEYARKWREANKEKIKGYMAKYWERKGQELSS